MCEHRHGKGQYVTKVVPDSLVCCIRADNDEKGIQTTSIPEFSHGNKIQITDGLLIGCEGLFLGKNSQQIANVLLELVGKSTRVEIAEAQLALIN